MLQTPNNVPQLDPEKNSKRYFFSLRASENKIIPGLLCYELLTWSYSNKKKPTVDTWAGTTQQPFPAPRWGCEPSLQALRGYFVFTHQQTQERI